MVKKFVEKVFGDVPVCCLNGGIAPVASAGDVLLTAKKETAATVIGHLSGPPGSEATEVRTFLSQSNGLRINRMVWSFLQTLAGRTHLKWPENLTSLYVQLFFLIAHEEYLPPFHKYDPATMVDFTRSAILLILSALEIVVDTWMENGMAEDL